MPIFLFSPLTWLLVMAGAMFVLSKHLSFGAKVAVAIAMLVLIVLCMPLGANATVAVVQSLGNKDHCRSGAIGPIVVLSGGFSRPPDDEDQFAALTPESWERLDAALRLSRDTAEERFVIAGGGPMAIKESDMLRRLALRLDTSTQTIEVELGSKTTWETAQALKGRFHDRIRLVTSPLHAPRAAIAFRAAAIDFCVAPSVSRYLAPGWSSLFPQASAVAKSEAALYELVGGIYYRLRGSME